MQCRRPRFDPWVRKIPWRRKWQPTPVSLPGESHGQRNLVGYSPWGPKESDTEQLSLSHMCGGHLTLVGDWDFQRILSQVVCLVAQSCPTLCDPVDHSQPGSSLRGILQARILEWVAISSSRGSSWPRDQTCLSCIGRQVLYLPKSSNAVFFI